MMTNENIKKDDDGLVVIFYLSQKGGTGKSTLARATAVESTKEGVKTLLADLDYGQQTSYKWSLRRKEFKVEPQIDCKSFVDYTAAKIYAIRNGYQIMIVDGPAFISKMTVEIAKEAVIVIHPVRPSMDDIEDALIEFNTLRRDVDERKFLIVINQVPSLNSGSEKFARKYFSSTPYAVLDEVTIYKSTYANAQAEGKSINEINHKFLKEKTENFMKSLINKITNQ